MKKIYLLLLLCAAFVSAKAEGVNAFYFTDAVVQPGETTNIELCVKNDATNLTCFEAEIQLPKGLSVLKDEAGNPITTLYRNRLEGYELLCHVLDSGNLKLLVSSVDAQALDGDEGPLLSFSVRADQTAPRGDSTMETVGESLLVDSEAEAHYSVGVKGNILITDDATGVSELQQPDAADAPVYNLAGQRLGKPQKGINIIGGRKELRK